MSDRPVRLSKAAREVNLGVSSVVEFLASKGFEVETNPNTKLTPEMYNLLLDEFQADRKMRKESEAKSEEAPEVMETIAIPTKEKVVKPEPEPTPAPPAEPVTPAVVETPVEPKVEETPVAETPPETPAEPAKEPVEEPRGPGLKVIDKIDLDGPKKKRAAEAAAKKEADAKAAEDKVTKDKADAEAKATADAQAATDAATAKAAADAKAKADAEPETIKAEATKLKGTTVLGKIELPVDTTRRKRKRIVKPKVDVDKVGSQNKGKRKPGGKVEASEAEIQKEIKETLARLSGKGKNKGAKLRRAKRDMVAERTAEQQERMREQSSVLKLTEFVTVSELASMMDVSATEIISACMQLGIFASINQRLDAETITLITEEFDYTVEFVSADIQESIIVEEDKAEDLQGRPPIITVMGHVDHGKTSLLDYVRSANVIAGEAGGITQHIGAYKVTLESGKEVTFLDTPGHEAFTAMRARGAQVTDLAIIVVAADDSVMPQTKEAINHAQAAGVPMIFAFNKIDKDGANPDKIRDELSQMNILVEDWGGTFQSQEISAKKGTGIDELMEKVLLEAELLELKANPDKNANGTVIESELDKGRGYVSTFLVEGGTLRVGDTLVAGQHYGKIKAMFNERGKAVEEAGPASPVSVLGMNGAPSAGDNFNVLDDEKEAKNIANKRMQLQREQGVRTQRNLTLGDIGKRIAQGEYNELNIVLKGDVDGSIEALTDSLQKLSTDKVEVKIIHKGVGQISESDISLASASEAIVIGFQVRPSPAARRLAEQDEVEIKLYSVIYAAIEEVKEAMEGMLSARIEEKVVGTIEVRETFKISKVGTIAGCFVTDGKVSRNSNIRLIRDGIVIYTGGLSALKRFKDDVKEVTKGYECGLSINGMNNIEVGDIIEVFEEVEVKQTLADS